MANNLSGAKPRRRQPRAAHSRAAIIEIRDSKRSPEVGEQRRGSLGAPLSHRERDDSVSVSSVCSATSSAGQICDTKASSRDSARDSSRAQGVSLRSAGALLASFERTGFAAIADFLIGRSRMGNHALGVILGIGV